MDNLNPFAEFLLTQKEINELEEDINTINGKPESNNLVDKYRPHDMSELIDLDKLQWTFNNWFVNYNNTNNNINNSKNNKKYFMILGHIGCGKTEFIRIYCRDNNIECFEYIEKSSKKEFLSKLQIFVEKKSFNDCRKMILFDEYQTNVMEVLSNGDMYELYNIINNKIGKTKNSNNSLKKNKTNKKCLKTEETTLNCIKNIASVPIVIISADASGSRLSEIKRFSELFYINNLNNDIINSWAKSIINKEGIKVISDKLVLELVKQSNSDKRLILNILDFLRFTPKKINKKELLNLLDSCKKDNDIMVFSFIEKLFDELNPVDWDYIFKIYSSDGFVLGTLVHENYLDYNEDISILANSIDSISLGDVIKTQSHDEDLSHIHCYFSLLRPTYFAKSIKKNNNNPLRNSSLSNRFYISQTHKTILEKLQQKNNLLTLDHIFAILNTISIMTNHKHIKNYNFENYKSYVQNIFNYGLDVSDIESIYKTFYISNNKSLPAKIKKIIYRLGKE